MALPFSVPKRKTRYSQPELLAHELLHQRKLLFIFLFGIENVEYEYELSYTSLLFRGTTCNRKAFLRKKALQLSQLTAPKLWPRDGAPQTSQIFSAFPRCFPSNPSHCDLSLSSSIGIGTNRQVPTQALLLGGCQHPVSTPSVDTYPNDIRFGRCQHWVSTPTKGDTALLGVDT